MSDSLRRFDDDLPVPLQQPISDELVRTATAARAYEENARAQNTKRGYERDWADFVAYCNQHGFEALPARDRVVQLYISWCADARIPALKLSSIGRRLAAIATTHKDHGYIPPTASPVVQNTWDGIRRAHKRTRSPVPKRAITGDELRDVVAGIPFHKIADIRSGKVRIDAQVLADLRDRAILLFLFLGGFRRSELAALEVSLITEDATGLVATLRESKTNQLGEEPERVGLARDSENEPLDPVRAYQAWCLAAGVRDGYVFRNLVRGVVGDALSDRAVHAILRSRITDALCKWLDRNGGADPLLTPLRTKGSNKRWVKARFSGSAIGALVDRFALPPSLDPRTVGAHSLRSGLVTTARAKGKPDYAIQRQTRHKHSAMLDRYTHSQGLWKDNISKDIL